MAHAATTRFAGITLADRFAALRAKFAGYRAMSKTYRTTVYELESLTDRDLSDLGISRSAIKGIAIEAARGN